MLTTRSCMPRMQPLLISKRGAVLFLAVSPVLFTVALWLSTARVESAAGALASPLLTPAPTVSLDVPDETLIDEDFQFQVKFTNAVATGYGPYIELYLPAKGADGNSLNLKCDGISFVSAEASFANPPTVALPPTYDSFLSYSAGNMRCPNPYSLPFAGMTSVGTTAPSGDYQLVVLELPFGSFDPSQPEVLVNVKANLSDYADVNTPLTIYARGGFRYGSDALDNHPADPLIESALTSDQTTPTVFKLKKAYLGPEDEAVSGPNFIGYYPLKYQLTADIADQQTINKLVITDNLPGNLQFAGNVQVKIKGNNANPVAGCATNPGLYDVVISTPLLTTPGGTLTVKLCSPIVGSTAPNDVAITFDFFIPDKDVNNQDILDSDCKNSPVLVKNDIAATGDWDPLDPRDPNPGDPAGTTVPVKSNLTNVDHVLQAKCVAIQKKVSQRLPNTGGPGLTPGDTLRYELNFQISDYRSMGKITITDLLSDGQLLVGTPTMTFLGDQFGSYPNTTFNASTFSATADPTLNSGGIIGGTRVTFRVSAALAAAATASGGHARHQSGILTGGHATVPTSSTPARGQIVFYAKIQNKFTYQYPNTAKEFVDKDDPLNNCVTIEAQVFQNEANPATVPSIALGPTSDGSSTQVRIAKAIPKKSVYAVKRGNLISSPIICGPAPNTACLNLPGTPQDVHPGDAVTFRIEYPIPSGDAEALSIEDWLPLPVFDVGDPDATPPSSAPLWPTAVAPCLAPAPYIPLPGMACRLTSPQATPGHTLAPPLSLSQGTANNLVFNYGQVENPLNTSKKIDLLFTVTATNKPFADGLFLTNEARENESNTFGLVPSQVTIAQVKLREPNLRIRKGIIATDNPNGEFSQPGPPPTITPPLATAQAPSTATFDLSGFNGSINSTSLQSWVDSDLKNVDANDKVTFAIVIENLGGHPAYDAALQDIIPTDSFDKPTCFEIDPASFKVKRGTGAVVNPLLYSLVPSATGFTITSLPGAPINAYNAAPGTNIVVITFQATVLSNITPGCCKNEAKLLKYTSQPGGPNFVQAGFGGPFKDSAEVCVKPKAEKCVVATSEAHTQADNSVSGSPQPPQVAVGEIIRYHLTVTIPEGISPFFRVTDHLPPGLTYMPGTAKVALVSSGGLTSSQPVIAGAAMPDPVNYTVGCLKPTPTVVIPPSLVTPGSFTPGVDPTFSLGVLTNSDSDNSLEYVVIEFNALVNNVPTNVDATTLRNNYDVFIGKGTPPNLIATSNDSDVVVVEPRLTMTKTVAPNPAIKGQTLTYTVQYTNTGTADAFDVELKDTLPSGLILGTISAGCPVTNTTSNALTVTCSQIPKAPNPGSTVIVTYQAAANPASCPVTLENRASLIWTSLPGPQGTTVNQTGSGTPGNSGAATGERNGVTPSLVLNNYATTASASVKIDCPCCVTPPAGMVGWWPMNETSGTTVADIMGGNSGVAMNGAGAVTPIGSGGPASILGQYVGNSLGFVTSYVEVPNAANLNFGKGEFSIDAWVRVNPSEAASTINTMQPIVDKTAQTPGMPSLSGYSLFIYHAAGSTTGKLGFVIDDGVAPATVPTPLFHTATLSATWYHVAVAVARLSSTSATVTLYVNGVPGTPTTVAVGSTSNSADLWTGKSRLQTPLKADFREGSVDELEIFNRAVGALEIQSIFNGGTTGKCRATINGVKFNDLNGNGVRDAGEPGLGNWTITATNQSNITQTTTTDAQGNYSFTVASPGTYTVAEVLQTGWTQTAPATGTHTVTVSPGQLVSLDFGNKKKDDLNCDLVIRKEFKPSPLVSGQQATAIITVRNVGTAPCHGPTTVTESMPQGLTLVSASVPGGTCVIANGVCTYPPAIPAGALVSFTYVFNVAAKPGVSIENCATMNNPDDTNPENNRACTEVAVGDAEPTDLTIMKAVKCEQTPVGTKCRVTLDITNNGPGTFNGFLNVQDAVTPVEPTPSPVLNLVAGSITPPGWSCGISAANTFGQRACINTAYRRYVSS